MLISDVTANVHIVGLDDNRVILYFFACSIGAKEDGQRLCNGYLVLVLEDFRDFTHRILCRMPEETGSVFWAFRKLISTQKCIHGVFSIQSRVYLLQICRKCLKMLSPIKRFKIGPNHLFENGFLRIPRFD
ncbi:hypothetical protein SDC9_153322 [bioreactor metagenome]|uniref:Uncharacterized protein n=1 Tax=bioreactor metagenome TaxID=1076179 RepID=A0A645EW23_9ZZZZ